MSDLQIVLMIFGGLIIVGVLAYNWWQERRFHQQVENTFSNIKSDALLEGPAQAEPVPNSAAPHDQGADVAADIHDDVDFSINHDLINEPRPNSQQAEIMKPFVEHTLDMPADFEVAETKTAAQMSEIIEATELPQSETADNFEVTQETPASHDGIKAIFKDAFNKVGNPENAPALNAAQAPQQEPVNTLATHLPAALNAQVDLIALLQLTAEATVEEAAVALKKDFDNFDKPFFAFVQTPDLRWLLLNDVVAKAEFAGQKITGIACSLQLADRAGPVSRSVINRFQLAVENLGLNINAHVEWQRSTDPATDAVALDAFCIDVDKTMGFHLVHGENGAFTGTKLRGLAEAQGLELAADGSFKYYDEVAKKQNSAIPPSFVMFNRDHYPFSPDMLRQSVVKGITFQLDIPHVPNCTEAFNHMVLVARQMETGLHAQLVDDNNRPLGDAQIEKIRHQLKIIQAKMQAQGIAPGSDVALRLFS